MKPILETLHEAEYHKGFDDAMWRTSDDEHQTSSEDELVGSFAILLLVASSFDHVPFMISTAG